MDPQWERAHQSWALSIDVRLDSLSRGVTRQLYRILRVKRLEREALAQRLPGVVRRGAQIDLEPIATDLRAAGIPCTLRRWKADEPAAAGSRPVEGS